LAQVAKWQMLQQSQNNPVRFLQSAIFPLSLALSHQGRGDFKPPSLDGRGWGRVQGGAIKREYGLQFSCWTLLPESPLQRGLSAPYREQVGFGGHGPPYLEQLYIVRWLESQSAKNLHPSPFTLHPSPFTLHPSPFTLHPSPFTLHLSPFTFHLSPFTILQPRQR